MKVLIIGASGMLAKPVISHLDKAEYQLRLFSRKVHSSMFSKEYEIIQGDVFNRTDLEKAIDGCNAIHISLSNVNDALATEAIVDVAKQKQVQWISIITGCTVSEENRWFPMIDNKFLAEQIIIKSGIPYIIFRPTWFFESLDLMIRDGKAAVIGKQPNPYRWVAADDYARMVATAYLKPEAKNNIFYVFGHEEFLMKDALAKYCKVCHPQIKKVSSVPLWLMKVIAKISGKKELSIAASLFSYFEKVKELGDATETNQMLGKPEITLNSWAKSKARK
jgi:uncharacterized protein YbjT (DUF2867 family)